MPTAVFQVFSMDMIFSHFHLEMKSEATVSAACTSVVDLIMVDYYLRSSDIRAATELGNVS